MRVLAMTPYPPQGPSSRQRVNAYQPALSALGVDLEIRPFLHERAYDLRARGLSDFNPRVASRVAASLLRRLSDRRRAAAVDLVWVHRQTVPLLHRLLDSTILPSRTPIAFDMDDAVFTEYPVDHLLRRSRLVTVGNEYLADYVRSVAPGTPVGVVPTVVDTDRLPVRRPPDPSKRVVVGWTGTSSTFRRYLAPVLGRLLHAATQDGAELRVVSSPDVRDQVEDAGAVFRRWTLDGADVEIREFDLGVMPLADDPFSRGKCGFKLIEYGAAGIPGVGSDVGSNRDVLVNGATGYLVSTNDEMVEKVRLLIGDPEQRSRLGQAARDRVEARFSVGSQVGRLAELLRSAAA